VHHQVLRVLQVPVLPVLQVLPLQVLQVQVRGRRRGLRAARPRQARR